MPLLLETDLWRAVMQWPHPFVTVSMASSIKRSIYSRSCAPILGSKLQDHTWRTSFNPLTFASYHSLQSASLPCFHWHLRFSLSPHLIVESQSYGDSEIAVTFLFGFSKFLQNTHVRDRDACIYGALRGWLCANEENPFSFSSNNKVRMFSYFLRSAFLADTNTAQQHWGEADEAKPSDQISTRNKSADFCCVLPVYIWLRSDIFLLMWRIRT